MGLLAQHTSWKDVLQNLICAHQEFKKEKTQISRQITSVTDYPSYQFDRKTRVDNSVPKTSVWFSNLLENAPGSKQNSTENLVKTLRHNPIDPERNKLNKPRSNP